MPGEPKGTDAPSGVDEDVVPARPLEFLRVRRVVAGDDGNVALLQPGPQSVAVGAVLGPQGRADLGQRAHAWPSPASVSSRYWGQVSVQMRCPMGLGLLDALQAQVGAQVHHVGGAAGGPGHGDGPVDGLLLGPVGAGLGKVLGVGMAVGDELVLQEFDDVAALAVQLQHAAAPGHQVHGLADVVVVAHAARALLVGHEHLEGLEAHVHGLGQGAQDGRPVLQDEVEAEVDHCGGVDLLANAVAGLHQRLVAVEVIVGEGDQRGHAGVGRRLGAQGVVVVSVQVDVGVDQAGQHELSPGVDDPVGGRQQVLGGHRHDLSRPGSPRRRQVPATT